MMRALLLDLDNTLYEYEPCNHAGIAAVMAAAAVLLKVPEEKARAAYDAGRARVKKDLPGVAAMHSRLLYIQKMVEALTGRTQPDLVRELHERFWTAYRGAMRLHPSGKKLIEAARQAGIRVIIVTDFTTEVQLGHLAALGIADLIDAVVSSEEAGAEKPDLRIYRLALEKAGCSAKDCLMVGNDLEKDVKGAEALGIRAVHAATDKELAGVRALLPAA
jgi:putative hydrolase of the HAD superfamily